MAEVVKAEEDEPREEQALPKANARAPTGMKCRSFHVFCATYRQALSAA